MSEQRELADQIEADQIDMDNIGTHRRALIVSALRAADEIASLRAQLADALIALNAWDSGHNSEYWLRWPTTPLSDEKGAS